MRARDKFVHRWKADRQPLTPLSQCEAEQAVMLFQSAQLLEGCAFLIRNSAEVQHHECLQGCGNSSMSGDMYSAGYRSITNIDYSSVCISTMGARYSHCPGMTWQQMDVRQLSFPEASFDVILEKATLDAIMVEEKSPWEVSPDTACFIHQALTEFYAVYPLHSGPVHAARCAGIPPLNSWPLVLKIRTHTHCTYLNGH
ncbi:uncharacterized protein ece2a isoform X3 [Pseudochaenichthys georgianus]|uniref:uncharacterized protein ece2a isoform X3 n=1 Tax=Pseudochaenichthys georgianus TaxID=52239 RepID=UPI0039C06602